MQGRLLVLIGLSSACFVIVGACKGSGSRSGAGASPGSGGGEVGGNGGASGGGGAGGDPTVSCVYQNSPDVAVICYCAQNPLDYSAGDSARVPTANCVTASAAENGCCFGYFDAGAAGAFCVCSAPCEYAMELAPKGATHRASCP